MTKGNYIPLPLGQLLCSAEEQCWIQLDLPIIERSSSDKDSSMTGRSPLEPHDTERKDQFPKRRKINGSSGRFWYWTDNTGNTASPNLNYNLLLVLEILFFKDSTGSQAKVPIGLIKHCAQSDIWEGKGTLWALYYLFAHYVTLLFSVRFWQGSVTFYVLILWQKFDSGCFMQVQKVRLN